MNGEAAEQEPERLRQGIQSLVNRVVELERVSAQLEIVTAQGATQDRELVTRVDELTRAVVRQQGNGRDRVKDISKSKALAGLGILGMTERHTKSGIRNLRTSWHN